MKVPIGDIDGGQIQFGPDAGRRLPGLVAIVLGLGATAASLWWMTDPLVMAASALFAAAVALGGLWQACRVDSVFLSLRDGKVRTERGLWPFVLRRERPLADFNHISLVSRRHPDAMGEAVVWRRLCLEGPSAEVVLLDGISFQEGIEAKIASLLGWPEPQESMASELGRPYLQRGITFLAWSAMLGLAIAALWPGRSPSGRSAADGVFSSLVGEPRGSRSALFSRGVRMYRMGDFNGAESVFRKALEDYSDDSQALNMLAYALADQQKLDEALPIAMKALAAAPSDWMIVDTVAEMHQRRKEFRQAAEYYRQALRYAEPDMAAETQCKYGETLLALGQRPDAITYLKRAASQYQSPWSERAAIALERLGIKAFPARSGIPLGTGDVPMRSFTPLQAPIQPQRF